MAHRKHTTKARPKRPAHEIAPTGKTIVYDPETRDFALYLDGQPAGFARTYQEGEAALDALVYERLTRAA